MGAWADVDDLHQYGEHIHYNFFSNTMRGFNKASFESSGVNDWRSSESATVERRLGFACGLVNSSAGCRKKGDF